MATKKFIINLWFDDQAEEAANYYVSIFNNSAIGKITRFTEEGFEIHQRPAGSVMTVAFTLDGNPFVGLNGGPIFKFSEAVSIIVPCDTQEEIDYYWNKLTAGGDPAAQQCGWLKDKFGLSWQIVPSIMETMMDDSDRERSKRVTKVMLQMKKLDMAALQEAYERA